MHGGNRAGPAASKARHCMSEQRRTVLRVAPGCASAMHGFYQGRAVCRAMLYCNGVITPWTLTHPDQLPKRLSRCSRCPKFLAALNHDAYMSASSILGSCGEQYRRLLVSFEKVALQLLKAFALPVLAHRSTRVYLDGTLFMLGCLPQAPDQMKHT